jgi:signal transduction histidine kinase
MRVLRRFKFLAILLCSVLTALAHARQTAAQNAGGAGAQKGRLVVVVSTQEPGTPAIATLIKGLREGLGTEPSLKTELVVEHLDRFGPGPGNDPAMNAMFAQKYQGRTPDLVVALGTPAVEFATRIRSRMWSRVPIVFADAAHILDKTRPLKNITGVVEALEMDRTLNTALQLFPETRRIVVVNGASVIERTLQADFTRTVQSMARDVAIESLSGLTFEQVAERMASLGDDSIAYFLSFHSDNSDRSFVPAEVLQSLAPLSRRPIFGNGAGYLGAGILGGWLIDYGQLGREVSAQALRILGGEQVGAISTEFSSSIRPMFDWRQMQRWGITDDRLPAGSIVQYERPSLWKQHRNAILTALTALLLQAALIATLLWERGRRRHAEARALALSGQVIQATETERSRIARELHDDISQRLALLSIEIDQFAGSAKAKTGGVTPDAKTFSSKTKAIADDIHQLAKELHPTTLKMLGLSSAVRAFCAELEARHEISISLQETMNLRELPEAVAISLYRVVQEALQNVVKHSGAREASVTFAGDAVHMSVRIEDQGAGFDTGHARHGIGLDGMRERLRLAGGTLKIDSKPGTGTRIEARIPMGSMAA